MFSLVVHVLFRGGVLYCNRLCIVNSKGPLLEQNFHQGWYIGSCFKGINRKRDSNYDKLIIKKDLNDLISAGLSLSAASKYLAKKNGLKKSEIYNKI